MKQRIITGIFLGLVFIPTVIFGGPVYTVLALLLSVVGTYELMNMFYTRNRKLKNLRFVVPGFSGLLTGLMFYGEKIFSNNVTMEIDKGGINTIFSLENSINASEVFFSVMGLVLVVYVLFIIILMIVNIFIDGTRAEDLMACVISLTYGGLLLGSALTIEFVKPLSFASQKLWGGQLFAYIYVVIVFTDIFAYFVGCKFGKHKLCPKISPKKSVEGAVGGLVFGSVFGVLVSWLFDIIPLNSNESFGINFAWIVVMLFISMMISIIGQIGDLVASKLKRTYEIKDYGNLFPGHGGVMDRFDSLILAGSFAYVAIIIFRIITLGVI